MLLKLQNRDIEARVKNTTDLIAKSAGATAEVTIVELYDVTVNDETLTERMLPTLSRAAEGKVVKMELLAGAEDFSFFGKEVPASFFVDESALVTGVRGMAEVAVDFLQMNPK